MRTASIGRAVSAALVLLSLLATACGVTAPATPAAAGSAPSITVSGPAAPARLVVDWEGPTLEPTTLPNGWAVEPCGNGVPALCVTAGERLVGTVETGRWEATDPIEDPERFLRDELDDFLATFAADRRTTCGEGYAFGLTGDVAVTTVDGAPALSYETHGIDADGVVHERGRTTTVADGQEIVWISAVASASDGCLGAGHGEFTPEDLETFGPWYDAIVRGSLLATASEAPAG